MLRNFNKNYVRTEIKEDNNDDIYVKFNTHQPKYNIKVGVICDTFMYTHFREYFDTILIENLEHLKEVINDISFIVFVESWGDWGEGIYRYIEPRYNKVLKTDKMWYIENASEIRAVCNERDIKIVYISKEDVHETWRKRFKPMAEIADIIYTLDKENITYYKELGVEDIEVWQFKSTPYIFHPMYRDEIYDVIFAGSYYKHHKNRFLSYNEVLYPMKEFEHKVYTKNKELFGEYNVDGFIPYLQICEIYKKSKIAISVSSFRDNDNFYPSRIPDIALCKTFILSSKTKGLNRHYPDIIQSNSYDDGVNKIRYYIDNDIERRRIAHKSWRQAMLNGTYDVFFEKMLDKLGYMVNRKWLNYPKISIVTPTIRLNENIDRIIKNYEQQNYPNKELIICTPDKPNSHTKRKCKVKGIKIIEVDIANTGYQLNRAIENSNGDWISKFDDDNIYMPNFLLDLWLTAKQTQEMIVGKLEYAIEFTDLNEIYLRFPGESDKHVDIVSGSAILFRREIWDEIKFPEIALGEDSIFEKNCIKHGYKIYSSDPFNYVCRRNSMNKGHTWKVNKESLKKNALYLGNDISILEV